MRLRDLQRNFHRLHLISSCRHWWCIDLVCMKNKWIRVGVTSNFIMWTYGQHGTVGYCLKYTIFQRCEPFNLYCPIKSNLAGMLLVILEIIGWLLLLGNTSIAQVVDYNVNLTACDISKCHCNTWTFWLRGPVVPYRCTTTDIQELDIYRHWHYSRYIRVIQWVTYLGQIIGAR